MCSQAVWSKWIIRLLHNSNTSCLLIVITVATVAAPVIEFIFLPHERGAVGNYRLHLSLSLSLGPRPIREQFWCRSPSLCQGTSSLTPNQPCLRRECSTEKSPLSVTKDHKMAPLVVHFPGLHLTNADTLSFARWLSVAARINLKRWMKPFTQLSYLTQQNCVTSKLQPLWS